MDSDPIDLAAMTAVRRVAEVLLPGDGESPPARAIVGLDELIRCAVTALHSERPALSAAVALLPENISWDSVKCFSEAHPVEFEIIATVAAGAYFMSTEALSSIGYPQGPRKAARIDQFADEYESGIFDAVMARDSMVRPVQE